MKTPAPGATLRIVDSPLNRSSNYWYSLYQNHQECRLGAVGLDGLWDVVFLDSFGAPHLVEGVDPARFEVVSPVRRWWQFWKRR